MNTAAEHDLAQLRAALDYPTPPVVPDVAAIIAKGRRRRARQLTLGTVVGVTGVLAMVAGVVGTGVLTATPPGLRSDRELLTALAGGPPPSVLVSTGAARPEAPERFDPLTRTLKVGWTPAGLDAGGAHVALSKQSYGATDDAYVNGGPDIGLVVQVLARGRSVDEFPDGALGLPREVEPRPTDPVNGGAAVCLSDRLVPDGTCSALRWEYAPGAWAQVSYAGSAGPTRETAAAVARRVAESVSLTAAEPVRLPFTLTGRLADLEVESTSVNLSDDVDPIDGTRWSASVELSMDATIATEPEVRVDCSMKPGDPSGRNYKDRAPTMTIGGHQAEWSGDYLVAWDVEGTRLALRGRGDLTAAFHDVEVLDDPTDPAGWVPLR